MSRTITGSAWPEPATLRPLVRSERPLPPAAMVVCRLVSGDNLPHLTSINALTVMCKVLSYKGLQTDTLLCSDLLVYRSAFAHDGRR